jgi:rRNA maturation endonuclease Nob1
MEGFDLTRYQNDEGEQVKIAKIMGKMMSGRSDYEAVIEKRKDVIRCKGCNWAMQGGEKFCPECGTKC